MNPRQRRAQAAGRRANFAFFEAHPDRHYGVRSTIEHEASPQKPVTVLKRHADQVFQRSIGGSLRACPDNEDFLRLLWEYVDFLDPHDGETTFAISPAVHADLLRGAGIDPRSL